MDNVIVQERTVARALVMLTLLLYLPLSSAAGYFGRPFDVKAPISSYKKILPLAEAGDPAAQNTIGFMHFMGAGAEKDLRQAHEWFHLSADQGYVVAQRNLGFIHSGAMSKVPAEFYDMEEANFWLGQVAQFGSERRFKQNQGLQSLLDEQDGFIDDVGVAPATGSRIEKGKNVYVKLCAGCHGFDGISNFKPAPSFALGERLEKDNKALYRSILNGLGKMPSWRDSLSPKAIKEVVYFIRAYFGVSVRKGNSAKRLSKSVPAMVGNEDPKLLFGEKTFQTFCVGCHGLNGVAFYVHSPSFALGERVEKSNAQLKRSIKNGKGAMPAWEHMLSEHQVNALLVYIRALSSRFDGFIDDENWRYTSQFFFRFRPLGEVGKEWNGADPGG